MSDFETKCNEYRENKRLIEELQALNDELKAAILNIMDGQEEMIQGSTKATYKTVTSSKLDGNGIKAAYPDIYTQYLKTSQYQRFTVV